jgi:hypothetical protein
MANIVIHPTAGIIFNTTGSTTSSDISERMRITADGLVGIGTGSPAALLETRVAGESSATGKIALIAATSNGANDIFRWYDGTTQLGVFKNSGNILIGTTTDNSYKLAVASGTQHLGAGFVVSNDFTSTIRQGASGVADFSGTTVTFDLATIFPRVTFTNRGLSVTLQLVAVPTYTITSSAFVVLGRTGNSNVWSNAILANININGVAVNSVSASGTVITVVYSTQISGTAYINLATIG